MLLLLGAGGFLGFSIASYLSSLNEAFATVSRSYQWPLLPHEHRYVSLASGIHKPIYDLPEISTIIYMAGSANIIAAEHGPELDVALHVTEMKLFFKALASNPVKLTKIIFLSSGGTVYGDSRGISMSEDSPLSPKSSYGRRNIILENLFSGSCMTMGSLPYSILRLTNPFGPFQSGFTRKGLVHALIQSSYTKNPVVIRGGGFQMRDYLFSLDFAFLIHKLINLPVIPAVINLASGYSFTARGVISALQSCGISPVYSFIDSQDPFEVADSLVSNKRLLDLLGIEGRSLYPFTSLKTLSSIVSARIWTS